MKLLFIASASRSGSTILERVLGQIEDFFPLGEVNNIWERSFIENQLCGCNLPFKDCPFWQEVNRNFWTNFKYKDAYSILELQRTVARLRYFFYLSFSRLRPKEYASRLYEYIKIWEKFYKVVYGLVKPKILIDSSKIPIHGFILQEIDSIDLYVLHIVRDSRGVVHSWQRKKRRPEIYWDKVYMSRYNFLKATRDWALMNLLIERLKRKSKNQKTISYEKFSRFPKETIKEIMEWLGLDLIEEKLSFFKGEDLVNFTKVNHTVSGNPIRFKYGEVQIKPDIEWSFKMPFGQKSIVSLLTFPFLFYYKKITD